MFCLMIQLAVRWDNIWHPTDSFPSIYDQNTAGQAVGMLKWIREKGQIHKKAWLAWWK